MEVKGSVGDGFISLCGEYSSIAGQADLLVHLEYRLLDDWKTKGQIRENSSRGISYELIELATANMRSPGDHVYQDKKLLQQMIDQAKTIVPRWNDK